MERDREAHKTTRELGWARPAGETPEEEFLGYYRQAKKLDISEGSLVAKDQLRFLKLNKRQIPVPPKKPEVKVSREKEAKRPKVMPDELQVFIFDIEDSFVYLDSFLADKAPKDIRDLAQQLDDMIIDIAKRLFFYKDLKKHLQPNIEYFSSFDDGYDLSRYKFSKDPLAFGQARPEDPEFGRERAYRARAMRDTYRDPHHLAAMGEEFNVRLGTLRERLDRMTKTLNSLAHTIFALLSKRPLTEIYIIAPRSLSRLYALCSAFDLDRFIRPENIYSTLPFERHWCLGDIKARHPHGAMPTRFIVCGAHADSEEDAKGLGCEFFQVRGRPHMMSFAQEFSLIDGSKPV